VYSVVCHKSFAGIYCLHIGGIIRISGLYSRLEVVISSPKRWLSICRISLDFLYLHFVIQGLEVNADKTKYMVISRDQNAGRSHIMKIDEKCFDKVEKLMYLGET
jgi:hypothetical protein